MAAEIRPDREGSLPVGERSIRWELFGKGERETFVLLNGLAMHTKAWSGFVPRLHPEFDVLLWDYPGQGETTGPDVPVTMPELAELLARVMDEAGVGKAHVLGISYGGFVALEFARLFGERLLALTLSGILLTREETFERYEDVSLRFYRLGPEGFGLYTHYLYEKIFGEAFFRRVGADLERMRRGFEDRYRGRIDALVRLTEAQDPFFAALDANLEGYRAIRAPTLVLAGEEDRAIPPWMQRKIAGILPNAVYEEIPGSGHVVYLERPDLFWPRVLRFTRARSASV